MKCRAAEAAQGPGTRWVQCIRYKLHTSVHERMKLNIYVFQGGDSRQDGQAAEDRHDTSAQGQPTKAVSILYVACSTTILYELLGLR